MIILARIPISDIRPDKGEYNVINLQDVNSTNNKAETVNNKTKIISWEATHEKENGVDFAVKYFYDGKYGVEKMWMSAHTKANGSQTSYYSFRPGKIMPGENIVVIHVGVASHAPKRYCSDQMQFNMYGRDVSTFHTASVNFSKCWTNTYVKPTVSNPMKGID